MTRELTPFRYAPRGYSHAGARRRVARLVAGTLSRERLNAIKDRYQEMDRYHAMLEVAEQPVRARDRKAAATVPPANADIERLDARLRPKKRLAQQAERVLRERQEPLVQGHLDKGAQDEILVAAAYEFLRLAAERDEIIDAFRAIQRKYVRTGSA